MSEIRDAYDRGFIDGMEAAAGWVLREGEARDNILSAISQRKCCRYYLFRGEIEAQPDTTPTVGK